MHIGNKKERQWSTRLLGKNKTKFSHEVFKEALDDFLTKFIKLFTK